MRFSSPVRGKGAVTLRPHWVTKKAGMLLDCSIPRREVYMIKGYRHLPGQVDTKATAKSEVAAQQRVKRKQASRAFRVRGRFCVARQSVHRAQRNACRREFWASSHQTLATVLFRNWHCWSIWPVVEIASLPGVAHALKPLWLASGPCAMCWESQPLGIPDLWPQRSSMR